MRRILYVISVAAALLLSASCSKVNSGKVTMESVAGTYDIVDVLLYYDDTEVHFDYETDYVYYVPEPDGGANYDLWSPFNVLGYTGLTFDESGKVYMWGSAFDSGITWKVSDGKVILTNPSTGDGGAIEYLNGELMIPYEEADQAYAYGFAEMPYAPPRDDWNGYDGNPHHMETVVVLKKR